MWEATQTAACLTLQPAVGCHPQFVEQFGSARLRLVADYFEGTEQAQKTAERFKEPNVLFIFDIYVVVCSPNDSKREERSGSGRGVCAKHRKDARRMWITQVTFPCAWKKLYKLKPMTKWSNCKATSRVENNSAALWHLQYALDVSCVCIRGINTYY